MYHMSWLGLLFLLAAGPDSTARTHLGAGLRYEQQELYTQAAAEFEQALAVDPRLAEARSELAVCYFQLRDYARARTLLAGAPADFAAYYLARIDLAEQNFDSAIRRLRSIRRPARDELYYLGVAYYKQDQYAPAVAAWTRAAAQNPRDFRVHERLARAYRKTGRDADAEREFAETRRLHSYYLDGSAAVKRCSALLAAGPPERAWETCRPLLDTDDVDRIVAAGMALGQARHYAYALEAWQKALTLDPESPEINYNFALTCFHLKDLARSREYAAAGVRLRPNFPEANVLYGTVLYLLAADDAALPVLRRAHELQPDDSGVRSLLAKELALAGSRLAEEKRWSEALAMAEEAATLQPGSAELSARVAQLRARAGRAR